MRRHRRLVCRIGAIALVIGSHAVLAQDSLSRWPDTMFHDGFEALDTGPRSDADAARFLAQTTFGPTAADIQHLRDIGYRAWFNEQLAEPMTLEVDYLNWVASIPEPVYQNARVEAWWLGALGGPDPAVPTRIHRDQLRQRVAFCVERDLRHLQGQRRRERPGTFRRALLRSAGHARVRQFPHPARRRDAASGDGALPFDVQGTTSPILRRTSGPTNYAREILQLFSIGLIELDADGTPRLLAGQPIPPTTRPRCAASRMYSPDGTGRTVTRATPGIGNTARPGPNGSYWLEPLEPVESMHDTEGPRSTATASATNSC